MSFTKSFKRSWLVWVWLVTVFFLSGLIVNCMQVFLLPLWYISHNLFRRINAVLCYSHWAMLTFAGEWWGKLNIRFYGKKEDYKMIGKEHALVLPNHRSDVDWLIGWILCERTGILGGAKCYVKNSAQFLPVIGWMWWFAEYVFLKRNWDSDQPILKKRLEQLKDFPIPIFLGIFPEGTRFTEAKHQNSLEFARSKGLPELQHHLFPRTKGVAITLKYLKDVVRVVYDVESAYPQGRNPTMKQLLRGEECDAYIFIRRIPVADIPCGSDEEVSKWCRQLFVEKVWATLLSGTDISSFASDASSIPGVGTSSTKQDMDQFMSEFFKNGKFLAEQVDVPRKKRNLIIVVCWNVVLAVPIFYALYSLLSSSLFISVPVVTVATLIGYVVLLVLLRFSDSKKGSKFGLKQDRDLKEPCLEEKNGIRLKKMH